MNGDAVEGKDLVAFGRGKTEQSITGEMYAFLLDRAVERILTTKAARARGITLGAAQKAQLAAVRKQAEARGGNEPGQQEPAAIELEVAQAEAELLQGELLAAGGVARPGPTAADVERYIAEHRAELATLPDDEPGRGEALRRIEPDIRARLLAEQEQAWAQARIELLDGLKREASITTEAR